MRVTPVYTGSDEEEEEEPLDEEAQLMASMGLPLAFGSTSGQRSKVSGSTSLSFISKMFCSCVQCVC